MSDLLRMDCFCLRRKRSVMVCLILAFVFALVETPLAALFRWLLHVDERIPPTPVSEILKNPRFVFSGGFDVCGSSAQNRMREVDPTCSRGNGQFSATSSSMLMSVFARME